MRRTVAALAFGGALVVGVPAAAQDVPRYEVGGLITPLTLREFGFVLDRRNEIGVGGRFTVNLTRAIAADAEVDVYPDDRFFPDRRKIQAVVGMKAGVRKNRIGVFGKVRPGFIHATEPVLCMLPEGCLAASLARSFDRPVVCVTQEGCMATSPGEPTLLSRYHDSTWFALDTGGVVEVYPSSRFLVRFDAGDTFVRFQRGTDGSGRPLYFSSHNLQVGIGAAVRF